MWGKEKGGTAVERKMGRVLVADGDAEALAHSSAVLRRAGFETTEVTTGAEALDEVRANGVALVLLEVRLPDMTGYEVCREIRTVHGVDLPVFFLTSVRTEALDVVAGLLLGADDFIVKPFEPGELVARVRRFTAKASPDASSSVSPLPTVTPREQQVLTLLADGYRQKEIAARLVISQKTAATHIQNLLGKLGVHSRAELVARAYQLGLAGRRNGHEAEFAATGSGVGRG